MLARRRARASQGAVRARPRRRLDLLHQGRQRLALDRGCPAAGPGHDGRQLHVRVQADDGTIIALNGHRLSPDGKLLADFTSPVSDGDTAKRLRKLRAKRLTLSVAVGADKATSTIALKS